MQIAAPRSFMTAYSCDYIAYKFIDLSPCGTAEPGDPLFGFAENDFCD